MYSYAHHAPAHIYSLSLHDALPIYGLVSHREARVRAADPLLRHAALDQRRRRGRHRPGAGVRVRHELVDLFAVRRSEEHTSELQSRRDLVCRLLLEKKKKTESLMRQ